jgi:signal transduction histidine kinase
MPKVLQERSISATKQDFPSIFKMALNGQEIITGNFKSKSDDTVSILATKDFKYMLDIGFKFNPIIEKDEEGNGYTIALDEIMVFGDGDTLEEALDDLIENTLDYTRMYFERVDFYKQIPNRRRHYPYLRRIATCATKEEVLEVISECQTNSLREILKTLQND